MNRRSMVPRPKHPKILCFPIDKMPSPAVFEKITGSNVWPCAKCQKMEQKSGEFARCGGCRRHPYCSQKCAEADWPDHQKMCLKLTDEQQKKEPPASKKAVCFICGKHPAKFCGRCGTVAY